MIVDLSIIPNMAYYSYRYLQPKGCYLALSNRATQTILSETYEGEHFTLNTSSIKEPGSIRTMTETSTQDAISSALTGTTSSEVETEVANYETIRASIENLEKTCVHSALHTEYNHLKQLFRSFFKSFSKIQQEEFTSFLDILAYGSVSPDIIDELQSQIDAIAQTSLSPSTVDHVVSCRSKTSEKLDAFNSQMENLRQRCEQTELCCENLRALTAGIPKLNTQLKEKGGAIDQILAENVDFKQKLALVMREVALLRHSLSQPDR
jgi:hypothetical protein